MATVEKKDELEEYQKLFENIKDPQSAKFQLSIVKYFQTHDATKLPNTQKDYEKVIITEQV
jgi:hypothetical protein